MWRWALVLGSVACSGSEPDLAPAPTLPPPGFDAPSPPPWQQTGEVGDLVFFREAANRERAETLRVAAVFGEALPDTRYPAACVAGQDLLCLPSDAALEVEYDTVDLATESASASARWVGDHVNVGPVSAPFYADENGAAYHQSQPVVGLLQFDYPLSFTGGEWGDLDVEAAVSLPTSLKIQEPDPLEPVVSPNALQRFRWIPEGGDAVVLTVRGTGVQTTRQLEDDGEAWLDFSDYRLDRPLTVELSRITSETRLDVNGNDLRVRSVAQQSWCVTDSCEPPFEGTQLLPIQFCWAASTCGESRFQLNPDGEFLSPEGFIGTWSWDCCRNQVVVEFTTGTTYTGTLTPDGCFDGEMESWSGNMGTWSGCL